MRDFATSGSQRLSDSARRRAKPCGQKPRALKGQVNNLVGAAEGCDLLILKDRSLRQLPRVLTVLHRHRGGHGRVVLVAFKAEVARLDQPQPLRLVHAGFGKFRHAV